MLQKFDNNAQPDQAASKLALLRLEMDNAGIDGFIVPREDEFMGEYAPSAFMMATFTHEGKLIDKEMIAGGEYLNDDFLEATLNKDMTISVDVLNPIYEKDTHEHGFYDNKLVDTEKIGKVEFRISKTGKIVEENREEFEIAAS